MESRKVEGFPADWGHVISTSVSCQAGGDELVCPHKSYSYTLTKRLAFDNRIKGIDRRKLEG